MIIMRVFLAITLSLCFMGLRAQEKVPGGFKKGTVVLQDSTVITGYIRDCIRSNAFVVLLPQQEGKRQQLDGNQLRSVEIEGARFICLKGDFFKVISGGEICLLQKYSDASARPVYNGTEALLANGTEGRRDDYFIYETKSQELKLLTARTRERVIREVFAGDSEG